MFRKLKCEYPQTEVGQVVVLRVFEADGFSTLVLVCAFEQACVCVCVCAVCVRVRACV